MLHGGGSALLGFLFGSMCRSKPVGLNGVAPEHLDGVRHGADLVGPPQALHGHRPVAACQATHYLRYSCHWPHETAADKENGTARSKRRHGEHDEVEKQGRE